MRARRCLNTSCEKLRRFPGGRPWMRFYNVSKSGVARRSASLRQRYFVQSATRAVDPPLILLDASAAVDVLLDLQPHSSEVAGHLRNSSPNVASLHLLDAEVGQVLRRYVRRGEISLSRATAAFKDLANLPLVRYPHLPLVHRAFELRDNATFYDALYLVLAEGLNAPLVTCDVALGHIPGHGAIVEVVA